MTPNPKVQLRPPTAGVRCNEVLGVTDDPKRKETMSNKQHDVSEEQVAAGMRELFRFFGEQRTVPWEDVLRRAYIAMDEKRPSEQPAKPAGEAWTDDELRALWRQRGGRFHGPNIEIGTMPESSLLPLLRDLKGAAAEHPPHRLCGCAACRPSFEDDDQVERALDEFERRERGLPQAQMAARLVAELRAVIRAQRT